MAPASNKPTPKPASAPTVDDDNIIDSFLVSRLGFPFGVLRCPNLKIRMFNLSWRPNNKVVFLLAFASYFMVLSGLIYDVIVEPPSIGSTRDPNTGAVKPVAFLQYRVNGQYIIEGLSAGFFFAVGGGGFILIDLSNDSKTKKGTRYIMLIAGILCVFVSYMLCQLFIRMKIPVHFLSCEIFFSPRK